jgi:predicted Zn-dependent protease
MPISLTSNHRAPFTAAVLACASAMVLASCATASSTPDAPAVADNARARGAQEHPKILAEFGGEMTGPVATYVSALGSKMAVGAGLQAGQCTFTVVNTDVINAFAVPGCYIYVTRGILAIMNSEDELASVLGHEIGHITADHSARRQQAATLGTIGAIIVGVASGSGDIMQAAAQAAQLYTLSYSRDQEIQADDLGLRYLQATGYSLFAASDMLAALGVQEALDAKVNERQARTIPTWARTHPLSADRAARAAQGAGATGQTRASRPETIRPYFAAISGMLYADDPEQGFIIGRTFSHPTLRVQFEAPQGFTLQNTPRAVNVSGTGSIRGQFTGGAALSSTSTLDAYVTTVMRNTLGQTQAQVGQIERTTVNGLPAASLLARAQNQQGQVVEVLIAAYDVGGRAYHFAVTGPAGQLGPAMPLLRSMRQITQQEAAALRPRQITIVDVRAGDTVASLSQRMAYTTYQQDRFLGLNGLAAGAALTAGQQVKIVTYGPARTAANGWEAGAPMRLALNDVPAALPEPASGRHDHDGHGHTR